MSLPEHDHERWADAAGAYVLRALAEPERSAFESHMSVCPLCREEVDDLRVSSDALALAVPPVSAPETLRARLMAVVEEEASILHAAGPEADRPARRPQRRWWRRGAPAWLRPAYALPAVLVVLVVGALGGVLAAGGLGTGEDSAGERSVQAVASERMAPNTIAFLEWEGMNATLVAEHLPQPPEGRIYQVWVKRPHVDPEPTSTLFMPREDGSAAAAVPGPLEGMESVIVSHEPPGGSPRPTSGAVLSVDLSS